MKMTERVRRHEAGKIVRLADQHRCDVEDDSKSEFNRLMARLETYIGDLKGDNHARAMQRSNEKLS